MYMGVITAARPSSGRVARVAIGVPVLLVAGVAMIPWLAGNGLIAGAVLAGRTVTRLPRLMAQAIDYTGEIAIGR